MKRALPATLVSAGLALCACSAWIDDFLVANDGGTDDGETTSGNGTGTALGSDDDNGTGGPECGHLVQTPAGGEVDFCRVYKAQVTLGCDPAKAAPGELCLIDEQPAHRVTLSPFSLSRFEVTNALYGAFIATDPRWAKGGALAASKCDANYLDEWGGSTPPAGKEEHPVTGLCWYAADAFCQWIGGRLPTEAEWEAAARGSHDGSSSAPYWQYPFGDTASCALANFEKCAGGTQPVGTATGLTESGLADMGGNAWEWVKDWYRADSYCDPNGGGSFIAPSCDTAHSWTDPKGDAQGSMKVVRGGSWFHGPEFMRAARRSYISPASSGNFNGVRCAK